MADFVAARVPAPFAIDAEQLTSREGRAKHITTHNFYFKGNAGSRAKAIRTGTTNGFGSRLLEDRSMMKAAYRTPPNSKYSRYSVDIVDQNRRHHPHTDLKYPLEPKKDYPLWHPKVDEDPEIARERAASYFQSNMIRRDNPMRSNFVTTTYKDFFLSPRDAVQALVGKYKERGSFPQFSQLDEESLEKPGTNSLQRISSLQQRSALEQRNVIQMSNSNGLNQTTPATADATSSYRTSTAYRNYHNNTWGYLYPKNPGHPPSYSWETSNK